MTDFPKQVDTSSTAISAGGEPRLTTCKWSDEAAGSGTNACTEAMDSDDTLESSSNKLLRNIKGIIFDFDGTLFDNSLLAFHLISAYPFDTLRLWRERLVRKNFAGRDYSTTEEFYKAFFSALGKACHLSPEYLHNWYFNRYMPRMVKVLKRHYKLRPGVIELFRCFSSLDSIKKSQGTIPGIAVYSDYPFLKERMSVLGINPSPEIHLYGPESFGAQKPAVRPFQQIAKDLGVTPEEMLVIGDREDTDGLGAFKAGMRFFCLETGNKRYFRLDPYRRAPIITSDIHGPSLIMYAGTWNNLNKLLLEKFGK